MKAIHFAPRPKLTLLLRRRSAAMHDALDVAPERFHFSRDALHAWFRARGGDVWFPSFHCGMEVRAAVDAGCKPRFYRVDEHFAVDIEQLRQVSGTLVVIHYFGFPQPAIARIAALCRVRGVALLEDCSHAFLSSLHNRPLGTFGDAATFSFYKSLGTVDGGGLRDGDVACEREPPLLAAGAQLAAWRKRWRDRAETDRDTLRQRFADRVVSAKARIFDEPWTYGRAMSHLSLALALRIEPERVIAQRRANYERLAQRKLEEGVVPLFHPLFVEDRVEMLVRLQAARIEPFIFGMFFHPSMDPDAFPDARRLRENLLCIPVHHDLSERDLARIEKVIR
jgi:perosamine synthetase